MPDTLQDQLDRFNQGPGGRSKRTNWGCVIALLSFAAAVAVAFGGCAYVVSNLDLNLNFDFSRRHLKPIPVPLASCPYLRLVRETASIAGQASGEAQQQADAVTWPRYALSLSQKLTTFDGALRAAAMHTPAPIAQKLLEVDAQVNTGVKALATSRDGPDWETNTFGAVTEGYDSLVDASDLTGNACGFTVAPDMNVFLTPFAAR